MKVKGFLKRVCFNHCDDAIHILDARTDEEYETIFCGDCGDDTYCCMKSQVKDKNILDKEIMFLSAQAKGEDANEHIEYTVWI